MKSDIWSKDNGLGNKRHVKDIRNSVFRRAAVCVLSVLLLFTLPVYTYATSDPSSSNSVEETKKKLQELKQQRDATQAILNSQQSGIADLEAGRNALQADLALLEAELSDVSSNIASINEQIQAKEAVIEETQKLLERSISVIMYSLFSNKKRIRCFIDSYCVSRIPVASSSSFCVSSITASLA